MTKQFSFSGSEFVCVIDCGTCSGSISFDFNTGEVRANRPENLDNSAWLICFRKFVAICFKMQSNFLND